jgi:hypothetical protein
MKTKLSFIAGLLGGLAACVPESSSEITETAAEASEAVEFGGGEDPSVPAACRPVIASPHTGGCRATVRTYQAFCTAAVTGNAEALQAIIADDMVATTVSSDLPWSGTFNGPAGFFEFFGIVNTHTQTLSIQVQQIICNPSRPGNAMVFLEERIKSTATGEEFTSDIANLVGVNRRGKLDGFKVWEDTSLVKAALTP